MTWNISMPKAEWVTPADSRRVQSLVNEIAATRHVAIDTETTGKDDVIRDQALYWSLSWGENRVCLPVSTLPFFRDAFRDQDKNWIFVNAKFDMHMLANIGVEFAGHIIDTSVMHALLYEERPHGLEYMSKELLGWTWKEGGFKAQVSMQKIKNGEGKSVWETAGVALRRLEENNLKALVDYASNDAYGTFKIYQVLRKELENTPTWSGWPAVWDTMWDVFRVSEMPFTTVLWNCEREGIKVNRGYLEQLSGPMQKDMERLGREASGLAAHTAPGLFGAGGKIFNPGNDHHVRAYYYKEGGLGFKPRKLTKGGQTGVREACVDKDVLEYLDDKGDPMAAIVRPYRKLDDFHSAYIAEKGLPSKLDHRNRAHTRFNQDIARTGRLSSSNPNLQNVKKTSIDPYKVRGAFIVDPGNTMIVADYDQLEMRLLACASLEPKMVNMIRQGRDIHMGNAEIVFGKKYGVTYDDIVAAKKRDKKVKSGELPESALTQTDELCLLLRDRIKSIGFGLNYGMKENKLARQLGMPVEEAKQLIAEYLGTYPGVSAFYDSAIERTYQTGYSFTLNGKRRFLPEIRSNNQMDAWQAERQAVNNEIQGTAANAAQWAMINIFRENLKKSHGCRMLLQVHDELVFECPEETADEATAIIREIMEHPFIDNLAVPLTVSIGKGPNWASAK